MKQDIENSEKEASKENATFDAGWIIWVVLCYATSKWAGLILAIIITVILYALWEIPKKQKVKLFTRILCVILSILSIVFGFFAYTFEKSLKAKYGTLEYYENKEEILDKELSNVFDLPTKEEIEIIESIDPEKIGIERSVNRSQECENRNGNYYENTCYGFSVIFPKGWEIKRGNKLHNLIKAVDGNGASIIINTTKFIGAEAEKIKLLDLDIIDFYSTPKERFESLKMESSLNLVLLDNKELKIFGQPAFFNKYIIRQTEQVIKEFALHKNGIMYTITFAHPETFPNPQQIVEGSIHTFSLYNKSKFDYYNN